MKKTAFILYWTLLAISVIAQTVMPEKRIYLMDITASMTGVDGNENIIDTVKTQLKKAIMDVDSLTEIVVVPFTKRANNIIEGSGIDICHEIDKLITKRENTNLIEAWEKGISLLDSTKVNYLFLLTDGVHNTSSKEDFYQSLKTWPQVAEGRPYYSFYLMLTHNAKDDQIRQIADSIRQMWNVETLDINSTIINADVSPRAINLFSCKRFSIPIRCNHPELLSEIPNFSLRLEPNPYYKIGDSRIVSERFLSQSGWIEFSITENVDKKEIPAIVKLTAFVNYDRDQAPLVFFAPEEYSLQLENFGQKKMDIQMSESDDIRNFDFGNLTFYEPFLSILESRPALLVSSLSYYPYKLFTPDTVEIRKELSISYNSECSRFGFSQDFVLVDKQNQPIKDIQIEFQGRVTTNGSFRVIVQKGDTSNYKKLDLKMKIPVCWGDTLLEGGIVAAGSSVDIINDHTQDIFFTPFASFQLRQKQEIHWGLWILWILSLLFILSILFLLFRLIIILLTNFKQYYIDPAPEFRNISDKDLSKKSINYSQAYLDYLDKKFEKLTALTGNDIAFVVLATALQTGRWIFSRKMFGNLGDSNMNRIPSAEGDKLKHPIKSRFQCIFGNNANVAGKYPSWEEILWGTYPRTDGGKCFDCCPYDAQKNGPDWFLEGGLGTHRMKTMGHDPVLGWIFGPANLMTQTITLTNFVTYRVLFPGNQFGEETDTALMFGNAIASLKEDPMRLPAALVAHYAHLKSDIFTSAGLPIPGSGILYGQTRISWAKELAGELYFQKYDFLQSLKDVGQLAQDAFWAEMINMCVVLVHGMYYNGKKDGPRKLYECRTSKIIDVSNAVASTGNVLYASFTQQWGKLDLGGIAVVVKNLISNAHFRAKIKEEYIKQNLKWYKRYVFYVRLWIYTHLCKAFQHQ